jgi:hypothetical protein
MPGAEAQPAPARIQFPKSSEFTGAFCVHDAAGLAM